MMYYLSRLPSLYLQLLTGFPFMSLVGGFCLLKRCFSFHNHQVGVHKRSYDWCFFLCFLSIIVGSLSYSIICLEARIVVIWCYENKIELNWIKLLFYCLYF